MSMPVAMPAAFARALHLLLALTVIGSAGFLHPVLCIEEDGRVRLEMDGSGCCDAALGASDHGGGPQGSFAPLEGCYDCRDVHFSNQGLRRAPASVTPHFRVGIPAPLPVPSLLAAPPAVPPPPPPASPPPPLLC